MIQKDLQKLAHPIADLSLLPGNPRRGDIDAVKRSLEAFGQRKPIVVRRSDKTVIAGNHTLQAAQALGWVEIAVVWVDDDEVTSKAFALADNRTSELGDYDEALLADLVNDVGSLNPDLLDVSGWDDKAVRELLDRVGQVELPTDVDDVPDNVVAVSKLGDVWLCGAHRVMCGDAVSVKDVNGLMQGKKADMVFTDPPYGVGYTGGAKKRKGLANDHVGTTIYADALPLLRNAAADHAALYLWYADAHAAAAAAAAAAAGYDIVAQIVWVKNNAQFVSAAKYHGKHEPCFYAHRRGKSARWVGGNNEVTVWEYDRAHKNEFHPTQKPVALATRALGNSTNNGDVVLDLFGGSGSTLIAAQETNRVAYLMELDPHYVDVICARFQKHTGVQPILESSGVAQDFLDV